MTTRPDKIYEVLDTLKIIWNQLLRIVLQAKIIEIALLKIVSFTPLLFDQLFGPKGAKELGEAKINLETGDGLSFRSYI